uniref:DUF4954 domain-containing protein n=1 Tax=Globisporangium ultimum (strain ATCC 200006 / CBS 805.95 / DAOM BR144) TaxID=431595 RepID=K3WT23_GLOUD
MRSSTTRAWSDPTELSELHPTRSAFVQYARACAALSRSPTAFFPLSRVEIEQLEANGNTAEDWRQVFKITIDAPVNARRIRDCAFQGRVVLGRFSDAFHHDLEQGVKFPSGCYRTVIRNAVVLDDALVKDTLLLHNVFVDAEAVILGCGPVVFASSSATDEVPGTDMFGNGTTLHVGVEIGGRDLRVIADLPFALAASIAGNRSNTAFVQAYNQMVDVYVHEIACAPFTIIAKHAHVMRCSRVENSFIGEYAVVDDSHIEKVTVLSSHEEPSMIRTKSVVRNAILQWNCVIETLSVVEDAFLCDYAHVERHGVVMSSLLGPNTSVAEGEVTSSFVGPFVGFHHQALLIASYWPQGKGNIGYGANVGSNHTLKAPDQELFPGEGVFFGLGSNVKFPSNFVHAPYSVIATGVTTLPQRLAMPFSLINTPGHVIPSLSPAINEISPGWVLAHSVFTVLRNEHKFQTRNQSKRTHVEPAIFRHEIIQYMKDARAQLHAAQGKAKIVLTISGEPVYTDREVLGLGKNYMRESARKEGIAAYTFFIQLYALDALLKLVENGRVPVDSRVGTISCRDENELITLQEEFPASMPVLDCLKDLVSKRAAVAKNAATGKSRDDARGKRIIPDYALVHKPSGDEKIVKLAQQ